MLVPHALRRTLPQSRSTSAARPNFGSPQVSRVSGMRGSNYELCRLKRHCKFVGWTLPQDSAIVSKTRSCLNAGS
jgi:hypothetical protein